VIDRTIDELDGRYFDIAEPLRRCQAMAAPAAAPKPPTTHHRAKTSPAGPDLASVAGRSTFLCGRHCRRDTTRAPRATTSSSPR
jgi:hypothetical protein